jgi:hypothetical protein
MSGEFCRFFSLLSKLSISAGDLFSFVSLYPVHVPIFSEILQKKISLDIYIGPGSKFIGSWRHISVFRYPAEPASSRTSRPTLQAVKVQAPFRVAQLARQLLA